MSGFRNRLPNSSRKAVFCLDAQPRQEPEVGRITLSAEILFRLAKALNVSSDEILGVGNGKSDLEGPSLKIVKRLKRIERLPLGQKKALLTNIDMFLKAAESG